MSTLHELVLMSNDLETKIIQAGGELTPELEAELQKVELELPAKIDGYAHLIDNLEEKAKYWTAQAEIRSKIAKAMLAAVKFRKDAVLFAMKQLGKDEVLGVDHRFKLMNASQKKLVIDEKVIPESYKMQVTEWQIDKKRIKADLEAGKEITGAQLEQTQFVRAFMNRGSK